MMPLLLRLFALMRQTRSGTFIYNQCGQTQPVFLVSTQIVSPIFGFNRVGLAFRIPKRVQSGWVDLKKDFQVCIYFRSSSSVICHATSRNLLPLFLTKRASVYLVMKQYQYEPLLILRGKTFVIWSEMYEKVGVKSCSGEKT